MLARSEGCAIVVDAKDYVCEKFIISIRNFKRSATLEITSLKREFQGV